MRLPTVFPTLALAFSVGIYAQQTSSSEAAPSSARTSDAGASPTSIQDEDNIVVVVQALTTTFTPPATCTEGRMSQLASPEYQIWANEPQPVAGTKITDCYPSEFIEEYTSLVGASSSIAPMLSPIVCPVGWITAKQWEDGYIACCQSGYQLALPTETAETDRPAYGGTCYSQFEVGTTVTVTAYDDEEVTALAPWVATSSVDSVYGHPMDGFALDLLPRESSTQGLSGGAIAGIVIGVLVAVGIISAAVFFLLRRRMRQRNSAQQIDAPQTSATVYGSPKPTDERRPVSQATATGHNSLHSIIHHQTASPVEYSELDGGWKGHEIGSNRE